MTTDVHIPDTASQTDYFAVFALPRKLNVDESALQQEFYRLSREYHPDRFARASAAAQQLAVDKSSQLNDAYRALKDPIKRTQHLLELEGVRLEEQSTSATQAARESGTEKKQVVPPELLEEVFELNMQLQELKVAKEMGEAGDDETLTGLRSAKSAFEERLQALTNELKSLWNHWDAMLENGSSVPGRNVVRDKMVALLNRRSYIRNLVRDVNAALDIQ
jgi:molecular chaperone HscB